jgi:hypothetical protein
MSGLLDATGIGSVADLVGTVIDKIWPDPTEAAKAKLALLQLQQTGELAQLTAASDLAKGQISTNTAEAGNESIFIAGWRPFIGWACGVAFGYAFVGQPLLVFIAGVAGLHVDTPKLDLDGMMPVLLGMLGLGAMRTVEKVQSIKTTGAPTTQG